MEFVMDEEVFNMSIRKFLKEVGVTSQREIEAIVRNGKVNGNRMRVRMTLTAEGTDLNHVVDGELKLS
jgi:16S rRNA U516 pseudouridylate synthase RsuA-like enzyme